MSAGAAADDDTAAASAGVHATDCCHVIDADAVGCYVWWCGCHRCAHPNTFP